MSGYMLAMRRIMLIDRFIGKSQQESNPLSKPDRGHSMAARISRVNAEVTHSIVVVSNPERKVPAL